MASHWEVVKNGEPVSARSKYVTGVIAAGREIARYVADGQPVGSVTFNQISYGAVAHGYYLGGGYGSEREARAVVKKTVGAKKATHGRY